MTHKLHILRQYTSLTLLSRTVSVKLLQSPTGMHNPQRKPMEDSTTITNLIYSNTLPFAIKIEQGSTRATKCFQTPQDRKISNKVIYMRLSPAQRPGKYLISFHNRGCLIRPACVWGHVWVLTQLKTSLDLLARHIAGCHMKCMAEVIELLCELQCQVLVRSLADENLWELYTGFQSRVAVNNFGDHAQ